MLQWLSIVSSSIFPKKIHEFSKPTSAAGTNTGLDGTSDREVEEELGNVSNDGVEE